MIRLFFFAQHSIIINIFHFNGINLLNMVGTLKKESRVVELPLVVLHLALVLPPVLLQSVGLLHVTEGIDAHSVPNECGDHHPPEYMTARSYKRDYILSYGGWSGAGNQLRRVRQRRMPCSSRLGR